MKSVAGLGVMVLVLAGASTARAQDLDLGELADLLDTAAKEFKAGSKAVLEKHDLDGDGRLNPEERRAADQDIQNQLQITRETFRAREESKFDVDGDGRLSPEERAEMQRAQEEQRRQWRKRMEEMRAEAERQAELEKWDKDKDGKLSEEELAAKKAAEEAEKKRIAELKKKIIAKYDTDKDGVLNSEELAAMKKKVSESLTHLKQIVTVSTSMRKDKDNTWQEIEKTITSFRFTEVRNAWAGWGGRRGRWGNRNPSGGAGEPSPPAAETPKSPQEAK